MYHNERGVRNANHAPASSAAAGTHHTPHTYGQTAASGPAPTTAGHHRHDILNKLDPRVDSTRDHQPVSHTGQNIPEGTYGPHRSRLANALDPRVDSDLDSTRAAAGGAGMGAGGGMGGGQPVRMGAGTHAAGYHPNGHGAVGGGGIMGGGGGRAHRGVGGVGAGAPGAGMTTTHAAGAGPHQSSLLNKLDPRVDSKTGAYKASAGARGPTY